MNAIKINPNANRADLTAYHRAASNLEAAYAAVRHAPRFDKAPAIAAAEAAKARYDAATALVAVSA